MEFKRLSEVTLVENATNVANVLIEEEGQIKRVPKTQVGGAGGGGGIATAIIKPQGLDDALNGNFESFNPDVLECTNMTFEEALAVMMSGNPLNFIVIMAEDTGLMQINANGVITDGQSMIQFICSIQSTEITFIWTADGTISMQLPPA